MKTSIKSLLCAAIAAVGCTGAAQAAPGNIVFAEVYGAGGNGGALRNADYAVLFNRSATTQVLTNWSIQYASQAGTTWTKADIASATIPAGGYYLVQLSGTGANGTALPTPDLVASPVIAAAAGSGKLALVRNNTQIGATVGCPVTDATVSLALEDFIQYGTPGASNVCGEGGAPTGVALSTTLAAIRNGGGCVDTDNNANDFATGTPTPRNSASPTAVCSSTTGACCINQVCSVTASAAACAGTFQGLGSVCNPTLCLPPTGSCCILTTCTVVAQAACTGTWTLLASCTPNPCVAEVAVLAGDVAYGASVTALPDSAPQIRSVAGVPTRVGTWGTFPFIQSPRFDNANGGNHNPQGNLLGLNFGSSATAGAILNNLSTNGTGNGQTLFTLDGLQFGLQVSRASGLSVSPDNTKVAMVGTDAGRVVVLNYAAGSAVGTGAGASITGGNQSDNLNFIFATGQSSGTAWNGNSELIVYVNSSDLASLGPAIFTIPVSPTGVLGTPVFRLNTDVTGFSGVSRFYALSYNPSISNFIYALASDFVTTGAITTTRLSVIDPVTWTEIKSINLTGSLETGREIAIGGDRNLYLSQFAGSTVLATSAQIDRLNLDVDNNGTISAADIAALTDNSSTNWYTRATGQATAAFNGLDVAISTGGPTTGACCLANGGCTVTTGICAGGNFQGLGTVCVPNTCPPPTGGRCCVGSRCVTNVASAAACNALIGGSAGASFTAGATNCNAPGTFTSPCCFADYNKSGSISVQDIFDFLNGWFSNSINADINNSGAISVQDIFDFLSAWFAGGC